MIEDKTQDWERFKVCLDLSGGNTWTQDNFEEIYSDFCKEYFKEEWKHITEEESQYVQKAIKTVLQISAKSLQILANEGYDALQNFQLTDEEDKLLDSIAIDKLKIEVADNTIVKFLIWCNNVMKGNYELDTL